jgi:hypothetical protein
MLSAFALEPLRELVTQDWRNHVLHENLEPFREEVFHLVKWFGNTAWAGVLPGARLVPVSGIGDAATHTPATEKREPSLGAILQTHLPYPKLRSRQYVRASCSRYVPQL